MLSWVIQQGIISLIVIILIHSIYTFLQNNLTTPKIRDLVNKPSKQYEEIYSSLNTKEETVEKDTSSMKNELQNYLKELSASNTPVSTNNSNSMNNNNMEPESASFSDNFSPAYQTL